MPYGCVRGLRTKTEPILPPLGTPRPSVGTGYYAASSDRRLKNCNHSVTGH